MRIKSQIKNIFKILFRLCRDRVIWPNKIRLTEPLSRKSWFLYVNVFEQRGRTLAIKGQTQASLQAVWKRMTTQLKPDLVLDVGVNYGEFLFATSWEDVREVYGFEGSPSLWSYIEKSASTHPSGSKISLQKNLAGAEDSDQYFWINQRWSGTSSLSEPEVIDEAVWSKVKVPMIRIDSAVKANDGDKLLFKVDVEGHELGVLEGMSELLTKVGGFIGLLEYSENALLCAGSQPKDFIDKLLNLGELYAFGDLKKGCENELLRIQSFEDVNSLDLDGKIDLIVCGNIDFNLKDLVSNTL